MLRRKASDKFEIGLKTLMCFTRDRFHKNRNMNVLMRRVRSMRMSSDTASDLFFVLTISLSILIYNIL